MQTDIWKQLMAAGQRFARFDARGVQFPVEGNCATTETEVRVAVVFGSPLRRRREGRSGPHGPRERPGYAERVRRAVFDLLVR